MSSAVLDSGSVNRRAPIAPRLYMGQMCGTRLAGAPDVGSGAYSNDLILSWFYPRYPPEWRAKIRDAWRNKYPDVLTSWQDDQAYGLSQADIVASRQELASENFRPNEWMSSKDFSPRDNGPATMNLVRPMIDAFLEADCISRYCVGAELDLWNTYDSIQYMINEMASRIVAHNRPLYVHFSTNRADWRPDRPGSTFADFWNPNQGKLSGLMFQSYSFAIDTDLQEAIRPILERFAGGANTVPDSGFGHPFDLIALENSAEAQFDGQMSEEEGNRRSRVIVSSPAVNGPLGPVGVMGSGNGL